MDLNKIREIEFHHPVSSVRVNGLQVWPLVRFWLLTYYSAKIEPKRSKTGSLSLKQMSNLLMSVFYGVQHYFGRYDYLIFSDSSERRLIDGKYVDKSVDHIAAILPKSLLIELPMPQHYPRSCVPTEHVVSKIPLYLLEWIYSKFVFGSLKIENEAIIIEVLKHLDISFNYRSILARNLAQHRIGRLLTRLYKPKAVVIQCAYTNTGFVKAFKESGIPVIEVQHGMLSTSHVAYNVFARLERDFFPDYFLSYGYREKNIFHEQNFYIESERVFPTGHYYLDTISKSRKRLEDYLPEACAFSTTVCITGQNLPDLEHEFIHFVRRAAHLCTDVAFIYIPRNRESAIYGQKGLPENFFVVDDRDTYEIIRLSNLHTTMFSTCAIEALALGTPNILVNIDNQARLHYGAVLQENLTNRFVTTVEEFIAAISSHIKISRQEIIAQNAHMMLSGYRQNIGKVLHTILTRTKDFHSYA